MSEVQPVLNRLNQHAEVAAVIKKQQEHIRSLKAELRIATDNVKFVEAKLELATKFSTPVFVCTAGAGGLNVGRYYRIYEGSWQILREGDQTWVASLYNSMYDMVKFGYSFETNAECE